MKIAVATNDNQTVAGHVGRCKAFIVYQTDGLKTLNKEIDKQRTDKKRNGYVYADENSVESIYRYFEEQYNYAEIPSHSRIIVEHYTDEKKRKYAIFHALYGRRVNDCLSRALAYAISRTQHRDVEIGINDNGFYIASDKTVNVMHAFKLIKSKEFRKVLDMAIDRTEILKRRFRHCAMRALMILRIYKGRTKHVGRQQVSSQILINAVKRISPDFSILKEARREVLEDLINRSINEVLRRTVVTSGTTLLVLIALIIAGGEVIHDFSLALFLGVMVGTYSSIFVASPIVLMFGGKKPTSKK